MKYAVLIPFLWLALLSDAQISRIYHRSGNVYSGNLIDRNNDSITFITLRGNTIRLASSEVDTIKETKKRKLRKEYIGHAFAEQSNWFGLIEYNSNFVYDRNGYTDYSIGAGVYHGYKFNSGFSCAVGFSTLYDYEGTKSRLGIQSRLDLKTKANFPFIINEFGLQRLLKEPILYKPFYIQLGLGYCFKGVNGSAWLLSVGYLQNMRRYKVYDPSILFPSSSSKAYYSDWFYDYKPFIKLSRRF